MKSMKPIAAALIGIGILTAVAVPAALAQSSGAQESAPPAIEAPAQNGRSGSSRFGRSEKAFSGDTSSRGGKQRGRAKPAEPEGAIGKDAAKAAALKDAGLTEDEADRIKVRLSDKDGSMVYKVSFVYEGRRYSYRVDPISGSVIEKTNSEAAKTEGRAKPAEPSEPEGAIGKDAAKAAALKDAGLTEDEADRIKVRLSDKDGSVVYKVSFVYEGRRYSYRVDPISGSVIEKTNSEAAESAHSHGHGRRHSLPHSGATAENGGGN